MNRNKCIIVVPIYKTEFDWDEYNSIKQLFKILPISKYDIVAICPESLDITYYKDTFEFKTYYYFWDSYFTNYPKGYNSLMLNAGFYTYFENYEYMLIYQPDCWVFRDELEYWVNKGYDYIGAPQIYKWPDYLNGSTHIGNGGFSLRNIQFFIRICKNCISVCESLYERNDSELGEDRIFLLLKNCGLDIKFNLPSFYEAIHFSFELNPGVMYQLTDNKLPFGCHAYKKIMNHEFWDDFIFYDGKKKYSVVTFLFGDYDNLRDPYIVDENAEYICITDRTDLRSNVWRFENIIEYDITGFNNWQKTLIARYTALNHITTEQCIIMDASIQIKLSLEKFINLNSGSDIGFIIHPFRDSYLDELDEWIEKRDLDPQQKEDFIHFCNKHNFDINSKGFIMSTVMFVKKTNETKYMMNFVLSELMNNYNFSVRVDQIYLSVIFFKYFFNIYRTYYSYQILNSPYFSYYYHGLNVTHENDYKPNMTVPEVREVDYQKMICKYLI